MIAGIDEAGKGPVLGPMCVAGVVLSRENSELLSKMGVRDSKQLRPQKRETLAVEIKNLAKSYFVLEVSPYQIDQLRKIMTMNEIMVTCFAQVLDELQPDLVFVDAADVIAARFGENVKKMYSQDIEIVSEHDADKKYPVVSAASILAKVERDALVRKLEEKVGVEIGSGYPADPKTMKFLEEWVKEHGSLPDFARNSWETARRVLEKFDKPQRHRDTEGL